MLRVLHAKAAKGDMAAFRELNRVRASFPPEKPVGKSGVLVVPGGTSEEDWRRRVAANQAKYRSAGYCKKPDEK